jgi:cytochrome oxidase assembly protein ShyY1
MLLLPGLVAGLGIAVLIGLGLWQLERKAWKEGLIAALEQRLAAAPVALPLPAQWPHLDPAAEEFRRVTFRATFLHAQETLLYSAGSPLRSDVSGPGYWVFTPARLADGRIVVVDRGFVPETAKDPARRAAGQTAEPVTVIGALRWPEAPSWFVPDRATGDGLWLRRDHLRMAQTLGWGPVAPFYVAQEAPMPAGGLPRPGPLSATLRNPHLHYALTWFGLAAVLAIIFVVWAQSRWRAAG